MPPKPLRTAIIGLSSSEKLGTSWAAKAHLPNLLTEAGRSRFTITALLNSSAESAKEAIKHYNLPPETKAYGDPKELANDPDVDLIICNTRVDKHFETVYPSILAGKDVYVEWPIAQDMTHIDLMKEGAKRSGSRVAVGLQRRWLPQILKLREILEDKEGKLGKVLSATMRAYGGRLDMQSVPPGLKYFADWKVGGNPITIGVGHSLDMALSVVGRMNPNSVRASKFIQRPEINVKDPRTGRIIETIQSDVPDLLSLSGSLKKSAVTAPNAAMTYFFRVGKPFPGNPACALNIYCENGEIQLTGPDGPALEFTPEDNPVKIQVHWFDTNSVEEVPWKWSKEQLEVESVARGVQQCLYAFADGKPEGDGWVGIDDAREMAVLISDL